MLCSQALIHDCGPLVAAICPPKALSLGIYPQFPPSGDESGQNPKNALKICASLRCNLLKYARTSTQPCANRSAFTLDLHARPSRSAFTRVQCPAFTRVMRSDVTSTASSMNPGFSSMREVVKFGLCVTSDGLLTDF